MAIKDTRKNKKKGRVLSILSIVLGSLVLLALIIITILIALAFRVP